MSSSENPAGQIDLDLVNFLEAERQASRFNVFVHILHDHCWDLCIKKIQNRLDENNEKCLVNCVDRFLDTSNIIVNRLQKTYSVKRNIDVMNPN